MKEGVTSMPFFGSTNDFFACQNVVYLCFRTKIIKATESDVKNNKFFYFNIIEYVPQ